jgi:hypothetical protein
LYLCYLQQGRIYRFTPSATQVDDDNNPPMSNQLAQNYPNPFVGGASSLADGNSITVIPYTLTQAAQVEITLYNLQGQFIQVLVSQNHIAGKHVTTWDGRDSNGQSLPSGTYLYRLKINGNFVGTKRLLLMK